MVVCFVPQEIWAAFGCIMSRLVFDWYCSAACINFRYTMCIRYTNTHLCVQLHEDMLCLAAERSHLPPTFTMVPLLLPVTVCSVVVACPVQYSKTRELSQRLQSLVAWCRGHVGHNTHSQLCDTQYSAC